MPIASIVKRRPSAVTSPSSVSPILSPTSSNSTSSQEARGGGRRGRGARSVVPEVVIEAEPTTGIDQRDGYSANDAIEALLLGKVSPRHSTVSVPPSSSSASAATTPSVLSPAPSLPVSPSARPKVQASFADFQMVSALGEGQFGRVFLARVTRAPKTLVALKVTLKANVVDDPMFQTERDTMALASRSNHPFLLNLIASFQTQDHIVLVLDYACGGDLADTLRNFGTMPERHGRFYVAELVLAVGHLHSLGIVHRDIKLDNILIMRDGHVKVSDFGLCKVIPGSAMDRRSARMKTVCGTPEYLAPEMLLKDSYTRAVDWWSVGVVLFCLLIGESPYGNGNDCYVMDNIGKVNLTPAKKLSKEANGFMRATMEVNVEARLGNTSSSHDGSDVREHAFFKGVDWTAIRAKTVKPPYTPRLKTDVDTHHFEKAVVDLGTELPSTDIELSESDQAQFHKYDGVILPTILGL